MPIKLGLYTDFKTGVKAIGRDFLAVRNSFVTYGMWYLIDMVL
jgi:hypothetical protein